MLLLTLIPVWILLLVQHGAALEPMGPCQVDCNHYGSWLGDLADDPFHCNMYYVCFSWHEWSPVPFACPDGEMFDTETKTCMKEGYTCSPPCQKCSYDCASPILGKVATFSNCSMYLDCMSGVGVPTLCPSDNPYFDGNICQSDYQKCCACKPTCSNQDALNHALLPDHSNCTKFYLCVVSGVPDETSHGHCPSGNFNHDTGDCDNTAPCVTTCTNGPQESGCIDKLICKTVGCFPRCTGSCDPIYFCCTKDDIGHEVQPQKCSNNYVVDPNSTVCVPPEECPV
ncbi:hypothetical protein GWK47_035792 [Chionoecetes opilio]|uniref:Chitin-binding type-2 domain-containing protein n=1 Tax=Chionoecetes opilio TaxID=41210 RepID=A0A8J4YEW6_CHIOP|nr:hypothetical protein GWK47_035792 [Chionoecetes opilio]